MPNAYFTKYGLFTMKEAHAMACQSRWGNSRLESRVRENRTHGLEGGEVSSLLYPYLARWKSLPGIQRNEFIRPNQPPVSSVASPAERCQWLRLWQTWTKVRRSVHRELCRSQGICTSLKLF
jgi:hypothetical protein